MVLVPASDLLTAPFWNVEEVKENRLELKQAYSVSPEVWEYPASLIHSSLCFHGTCSADLFSAKQV